MSQPGIFKYVKEVMKDSDGSYSNKRFITTAAFIFMTIAFFSNLYWGFTVTEYIFNAMATVVMAGLASTVGERFATAWVERAKGNPVAYPQPSPVPPLQPVTPGEG
jgi:hypothetical protein